ncbi:MAG: DUF4317 family protein [Eubacteriales bacterium]|nr:DUF4317 family protein [Eubacteriales bacterium]
MIKREDMLELTRRMTLQRSNLVRIAGAYLDEDGEIDGTFNTNWLNLPPKEKTKNLAIAKAIPFAKANEELKEYRFPKEERAAGSMWQLLTALLECGLKNDALCETFYELAGARYPAGEPFAIFLFYGRYDVPLKASDKESLWESEEVYEYLIGAFCPLTGEYEPGLPKSGFLFPLFSDRSADIYAAAVKK